MIEHIVLVKVQAGTSSEAVQRMLDGLHGLPAIIPEIRYLSCGMNISDRGAGFTRSLRLLNRLVRAS